MEITTPISEHISYVYQKASYDVACKRLLSFKIILAYILKYCIDEFKDIDVNEIAEYYIEGYPQICESAVHVNHSDYIISMNNEDSTFDEGTIYYDIIFYAIAPYNGELIKLLLNIEAQNDFYPGYPLIMRAIYYACRMISAQYGKEFTKANYNQIKKVYSIWICANPPKTKENTITKYEIEEKNIVGYMKEKKNYYDLMTVIMICLGTPQENIEGGVLRLLEVLLSNKRDVEEKKKILATEFHIKMSEDIEEEVMKMCNLSEGIEREGIEKGLYQGIKNIMKNLHLDSSQAMEILGISKEDYPKYKDMLERMSEIL